MSTPWSSDHADGGAAAEVGSGNTKPLLPVAPPEPPPVDGLEPVPVVAPDPVPLVAPEPVPVDGLEPVPLATPDPLPAAPLPELLVPELAGAVAGLLEGGPEA